MSRLIIACCSLLLSAQVSLAQQVTLVGPDLEPKATSLDAISLGDEGLVRLRLRSGPTTPLNDKQYVARLVDGQVFVGTLLGAGEDGESIRLALGFQQRLVVLPLDELLSLTLVGTTVQGDATDDTLLLATGETLVGFVDSVGDQNIGFVVGEADDPIEIPMDRVRGFSIANKPEPIEAEKGLARVVLRCGSSLWLRDVNLKPATETARASLTGTQVIGDESIKITLPFIELHLIEPRSGRYALQRLADSTMTLLSGGQVFSVKVPPTIDHDGNIRLHAPTTVGFDIPKGASRVAFTVALDLDESIPESRRAMAGCELVVYDGDDAIARHTLTPDGPAKRLNVPLTHGELRLALESGVNGPVLDRVVLTDAEVLVSE